MKLRGKTALVTGAGSGAGRGIALALARAGCPVVVDIDRSGGEATVESARAAGGRAEFFEADVADEAAARAMVAFAEARFGGLDLMVNNAGVVEYHTGHQASFPDVPVELWSRMLDINLRGVVLGTQFAIEAMKKRGGGAIVNVASGAGIGLGPNDAPVYAAAKAGVVRFTAALAFLKDQHGIRVNCICPGWIDSAMSRRTRAEMTPAEWAAIAPKTMLSPDELAISVLRLLGDDRLAGRVMLHYEGERPRLLRRDRAKSKEQRAK